MLLRVSNYIFFILSKLLLSWISQFISENTGKLHPREFYPSVVYLSCAFGVGFLEAGGTSLTDANSAWSLGAGSVVILSQILFKQVPLCELDRTRHLISNV